MRRTDVTVRAVGQTLFDISSVICGAALVTSYRLFHFSVCFLIENRLRSVVNQNISLIEVGYESLEEIIISTVIGLDVKDEEKGGIGVLEAISHKIS